MCGWAESEGNAATRGVADQRSRQRSRYLQLPADADSNGGILNLLPRIHSKMLNVSAAVAAREKNLLLTKASFSFNTYEHATYIPITQCVVYLFCTGLDKIQARRSSSSAVEFDRILSQARDFQIMEQKKNVQVEKSLPATEINIRFPAPPFMHMVKITHRRKRFHIRKLH